MTPRSPQHVPAYEELPTRRELHQDAQVTQQRLRLQRAERAALRRPAPSLRYADQPREVPKRPIRVDEATARLAAALHLHVH